MKQITEEERYAMEFAGLHWSKQEAIQIAASELGVRGENITIKDVAKKMKHDWDRTVYWHDFDSEYAPGRFDCCRLVYAPKGLTLQKIAIAIQNGNEYGGFIINGKDFDADEKTTFIVLTGMAWGQSMFDYGRNHKLDDMYHEGYDNGHSDGYRQGQEDAAKGINQYQ